MINNDLVQVLLYIGCLVILTPPLGLYCARVLNGEKTFLTAFLGPLEKLFYRLSGINSCAESDWKGYAKDLLVFNAVGFGVLFLMQIFQNYLPLNPNHAGNISWHSAFNTAVSFVTNTNWQAYAGETAMSYLVQMAGLGVQNFVSAATGIAVFAALTRGIVRRQSGLLGNFWADTLRATLYILLPLSFVLALFLAGEGVIQNFSRNREIVTVESVSQTLPMGPAASQIAIKQLGTNGGGYFNANSAHPFENPTPLSNFLEMLAILLIPSALVYSYGVLTGAKKHAYVLYGIMLAVFLAGFGASLYCEHAAGRVAGVNLMEGKETRFGIVNSVLWSCATTAASSGSVNAMHSSLSPLSGGVALFNMMLGEIIFGGVGAGMYGMLLFVMLAVFLAGLMVGRTPEYMGKKIEKREIQMVITGVLAPSVAILAGTALACVLPVALSSLSAKGPHGFSELLYAFTSAGANNGSAFAGLNANTVFYNTALGAGMLIGRFGVIIPCLAVAGSLSAKQAAARSSGTMPTDSVTFAVLLLGVIVIVGALTFFPALSLGPVIEHFMFINGTVAF